MGPMIRLIISSKSEGNLTQYWRVYLGETKEDSLKISEILVWSQLCSIYRDDLPLMASVGGRGATIHSPKRHMNGPRARSLTSVTTLCSKNDEMLRHARCLQHRRVLPRPMHLLNPNPKKAAKGPRSTTAEEDDGAFPDNAASSAPKVGAKNSRQALTSAEGTRESTR